MSQNLEDNRKSWPKDEKWEPRSDYDQGGKYHKVHATTWRAGHSVEVDETEGGERIRVTHSKGSYVDFRPDGSTIIRSNGNSYEIVVSDKNVKVKGSVNIHVEGDADIKVDGDVTGKVGGKWKMDVADGIEFITPIFTIKGNRVEHNGKNIGHDHVHDDVMAGPSVTGPPLP